MLAQRTLARPAALQHLRRQQRRAAPPPRAAAGAAAGAAGAAADGGGDGSSGAGKPGQRFSVTLPKPVGVVFSQKEGTPVFIESVVPGGNADKAGILPGDILSQCSAITLKAGKEGAYEREGHGARPYDNFDSVMIDTEDLAFKTVMAALKSNNDRWGVKTVTLVVRRLPAEEGAGGGGEPQPQ
ncbi:MAG: hypothetical protein J3K34DRAFT_522286 [Monoraphidium minutum]|nr:MAG: hypothetical protein J3K34DRAFT_522286 [Monoraphidium minutum]